MNCFSSSRRQTVAVKVGNITIGGGAPVVVQSMTNTDTADIEATAQQSYALWQAGSVIVRITVNTREAAKAVPHIYERLQQLGWENPHLVGDFHYIGHTLLTEFPDCAKSLVKYRINPGNVGFGDKHDPHFATMIEAALKYDKSIRIGVNWGSIDQDLVAKLMDENAKKHMPQSADALTLDALILSALTSAKQAEYIGLPRNRIILSCKVSRVPELVQLYTQLAQQSDYALHLGLTEAGMGNKGIVATTAALAILLQQGIGDTIRASLTPAPGGDRTEEVRICQEILQSLGLHAFMPEVSACPGCGRTTSQFFQTLAQRTQQFLEDRMHVWKTVYPGVEHLKVAVMGCVVNGPGESQHADIGISLPGTGERPVAPVYIDGKKFKILRGESLVEEFHAIIEHYVQKRFSVIGHCSE